MSFDPSKAYHGDWQYQDFIEEVSWIRAADGGSDVTTGLKARFGDFDTPELVSLAAGLAFTHELAAVVLWEPKPSDVVLDDWLPIFAPKSGQLLRRDDHDGERWLIVSAKQSRFGYWLLACEREATNG